MPVPLPAKRILNAISRGDAYIVNTMLTLPADGSTNVHVRNSNGSKTKGVWVVDASAVITGDSEVHLIDSFDSVTDGDDLTHQNAFMDSDGGPPDEGDFDTFTDSTYTTANGGKYPIGLTSDKAAVGHNLVFNPTLLDPGREFIIEVTDKDSTQHTALLSLFLVEAY